MKSTKRMEASYHWICPSQAIPTRMIRLMVKMIESRVKGNQSNLTGFEAAKLAQAATPRVLNNMEPIIVPRPISVELATKVLIMFVNSSGVVDATDIKVAAATSCPGERKSARTVR